MCRVPHSQATYADCAVIERAAAIPGSDEVCKRLATGIMRERGSPAAGAIMEAFCSPSAPILSDHNASLFFEATANVLTAHLTGVVE